MGLEEPDRRTPKTAALYQLDILAALTQTGIRQTAAGGKARAFCDIVDDKIGEMQTISTSGRL